ncbi:hypothetical protein E2C01_055054 [Portunus trituberculatus]|uniref:Uncharacterized protein n=1 Tax=Portunus trituberculatus TaxID=210409 RepID=A0A5B7GQ70_PORTR|nr:hypothetical protein [Portunus trituberculatus]
MMPWGAGVFVAPGTAAVTTGGTQEASRALKVSLCCTEEQVQQVELQHHPLYLLAGVKEHPVLVGIAMLLSAIGQNIKKFIKQGYPKDTLELEDKVHKILGRKVRQKEKK